MILIHEEQIDSLILKELKYFIITLSGKSIRYLTAINGESKFIIENPKFNKNCIDYPRFLNLLQYCIKNLIPYDNNTMITPKSNISSYEYSNFYHAGILSMDMNRFTQPENIDTTEFDTSRLYAGCDNQIINGYRILSTAKLMYNAITTVKYNPYTRFGIPSICGDINSNRQLIKSKHANGMLYCFDISGFEINMLLSTINLKFNDFYDYVGNAMNINRADAKRNVLTLLYNNKISIDLLNMPYAKVINNKIRANDKIIKNDGCAHSRFGRKLTLQPDDYNKNCGMYNNRLDCADISLMAISEANNLGMDVVLYQYDGFYVDMPEVDDDLIIKLSGELSDRINTILGSGVIKYKIKRGCNAKDMIDVKTETA